MIFKNVNDQSLLSTGQSTYTRLGDDKKFNFVGKVVSRRTIKEFVNYCEAEAYAGVEPVEIIKRKHPRNGESMGIKIKKSKAIKGSSFSISKSKPKTFDQTGFESLKYEDPFTKKVNEMGRSIDCAMSGISKHILDQFSADYAEEMKGLFGALNCTTPSDKTLSFDDLLEACLKLDRIIPRPTENKVKPVMMPILKPQSEALEWAKNLRFSLSGGLRPAVKKGGA